MFQCVSDPRNVAGDTVRSTQSSCKTHDADSHCLAILRVQGQCSGCQDQACCWRQGRALGRTRKQSLAAQKTRLPNGTGSSFSSHWKPQGYVGYGILRYKKHVEVDLLFFMASFWFGVVGFMTTKSVGLSHRGLCYTTVIVRQRLP